MDLFILAINLRVESYIELNWSWPSMKQLFVPLLQILWGDYTWKHICYQWRKKLQVYL
jgi:hypothetical protein